MRYLKLKNNKRLFNFCRVENDFIVYKTLYRNSFFWKKYSNFFYFFFSFSFLNDFNFCKVHQRCFITNRSRAILYKYKISRIKFREFASFGNISGFFKGS